MKFIADEWKLFKESDDFEAGKAEWEKLSSSDELPKKKEKKAPKKTKKPASPSSDDDVDNSPQATSSDSEVAE